MKRLPLYKLMQMCDAEKLKKISEANPGIPQQYTVIGLHELASFSPFPSIMDQGIEALKKRKSFARIKCAWKQKIVAAFTEFSKTNESAFNIRKKHHILEFQQSKISNFIIAMVGTVDNCIDNKLYDCYYITTIEPGAEVFIAIEKSNTNHSNAIEEIMNQQNLFKDFEFYGNDFSQIYNFSIDFISYITAQKNDELTSFIPKNYTIVENEEYQEHIKHNSPENNCEITTKPTAEPCTNSTPEQTVEWFIPGILKNYDYKLDVYSQLMKLLSLADSNKMLFLLGFFFSNSLPQLSENRNHISLALISTNQTSSKRLCDILFRIVLNEESHTAIPFAPEKEIEDYFELCPQLPLISTIKDFNKTDRQNLTNSLNLYHKSQPKKLKEAIIILTSKEIANVHLHNLAIDISDPSHFERTVIDLKNDTSLKETIQNFLNYMQNRYADKTIFLGDYEAQQENNSEYTKLELSKKEKFLSKNSQLTNEEVLCYAPIVYFLEEYAKHLSQTKAISEEQHHALNNQIKKLYIQMKEELVAPSNFTVISPTEISNVLLKCIAKAYHENKFDGLTSEDNAYPTNTKNGIKLLCFHHQQSSPLKYVIEFLEGAGMGKEIEDIRETAMQSATGDEVKKIWRESGFTYSPEGRLLYPTRNGTALAIISSKLEDLI